MTGSRLTSGCPWKETLPLRPKPWSDIKLSLAYGDKSYLRLASSEQKDWLANVSPVKALDARNFERLQHELNTFQWIFKTKLSVGLDPEEGTCVKYGDKVYLQGNNGSGWLSGGRGQYNGQVVGRDYNLDVPDITSYEWIVLSEPGNGSRSTGGSTTGRCVTENDSIYLQVNNVDKRWLTRSSTDTVITKDIETSDDSAKEYYKWSVEMSTHNMGEQCWTDGECDSGRCSLDWICEAQLENGEGCFMNDDCISGRCESSIISPLHRTCQSKAGEYSKCNENSDCLNNECTWGFICGDACVRSHTCDTGRCSNKFTCEARVEDGADCMWNTDCKTGNCVNLQMKCGRWCAFDSQCDEATERCDKGFICLPKKKVGGSCFENEDCEGPLGCSWALTCGEPCIRDKECSTGRCSKNLICEDKLPNGQYCGADNDCTSERCASNLPPTCQPKSAEGETCGNDGDCMKGKCSWAFTCGKPCFKDNECSTGRCSNNLICEKKLPNGKGCFEDDDCNSGRCSKTLKCEPKSAEGGTCGNDGDCMDGKCSWAFTCGKPCIWDNQCSTGRCSNNLICEKKLPNGKGCVEDDDCNSGRCDKFFKCQNKLSKGSACWQNDDCQSNRCEFSWGYFKCK